MDKCKNLINLLNEAIIETDTKGFIKEASPAAANLCGYKSPEDLKGIHIKTIYAYPEARNSIIKKLEKEGGFLKNFEFLLKQKDGTTRHTICNIRMLINSNGKFTGTISACRDISERKESEEALLESQKNFRDLIAKKDKFFSIISHDLRSPLSAIFNFSELALKKLE